MKGWVAGGLALQLAVYLITNQTPANAEFLVRLKPCQAAFEIIRIKGKIRVEFHQEFPRFLTDRFESLVKRVDHSPALFAKAPVRTVHCHHRRMRPGRSGDDFCCAV